MSDCISILEGITQESRVTGVIDYLSIIIPIYIVRIVEVLL